MRATIIAINDYRPPPSSKTTAIRHQPLPSTSMAMLGREGGGRHALVLAGWQPGVGGIEG